MECRAIVDPILREIVGDSKEITSSMVTRAERKRFENLANYWAKVNRSEYGGNPALSGRQPMYTGGSLGFCGGILGGFASTFASSGVYCPHCGRIINQ